MLLRQYELGDWMDRTVETIRVPRAWDFEHACLDLVLRLEHLGIYLAHRSASPQSDVTLGVGSVFAYHKAWGL
jgi:hypothetical protein